MLLGSIKRISTLDTGVSSDEHCQLSKRHQKVDGSDNCSDIHFILKEHLGLLNPA